MPRVIVFDEWLACKERCEFESRTFLITETRLLGNEEEGTWQTKGAYFDKVDGDFQRLSLYLTQGTVRRVKEPCFLSQNHVSFIQKLVFCIYYLKNIVLTVTNGTYYVISPICCNHCIPCFMHSMVIYSFL